MEYLVKEHLERISEQRRILIDTLSDLNENLPSYGLKVLELSNQISNIDILTRDLVFAFKDVEIIQLQNKLTIETSK